MRRGDRQVRHRPRKGQPALRLRRTHNMSNSVEIKVPDIGDFDAVEVIEILVAAGDKIEAEQSLITVESDKASMEIPASQGGVVKAVKVKLGDKVKEGSVILEVEASGAATGQAASAPAAAAAPAPAPTAAPAPAPASAAAAAPATSGGLQPVVVPDIGDFDAVEVIEILVNVGDTIQAEQSLITVESDKASMEIPASVGGVVKEIKVKLGDKVSQGAEILVVEATGGAPQAAAPAAAAPAPAPAPAPAEAAPKAAAAPAPASAPSSMASVAPERTSPTASFAEAEVPLRNLPHASPSVRKFARELGVNLAQVSGSGPKNRITVDDVRAYVKQALATGGASPVGSTVSAEGGFSVLGWPKVDFAKFGEIQTKPLSRIKKISGANLHRNWVMIPHVTNNDVADITELEALRQQLNAENKKSGVKVTMLAFLIKAVVAALKKYPEFNASLDGDNLVLKHYFHIGFAADTPNGLVVPVIRDADKKGVLEL